MALDLQLATQTITHHHGRPSINCLHLLRLPLTYPILLLDSLLRGKFLLRFYIHHILPFDVRRIIAAPHGTRSCTRIQSVVDAVIIQNLNIRICPSGSLTRVTHLR